MLKNDPELILSPVYYRLKLISENANDRKYSKAIVLFNRNASFKISTVNPFKSNLKVYIFIPEPGNVAINLCDVYGKIVSKKIVQFNQREYTDNSGRCKQFAGCYVYIKG